MLVVGALVPISVAIVFITGRYTMLVDVGAGVESMVYALAGLAVFRLRRKSRITESTSESSSQTMPDATTPV